MAATNLSNREKSILLFFLTGTLSDLSKALFFFIVFYILGIHIEFLYSLLFLILYRIYCGGLHCKTYIQCLLVSFIFLSCGMFLGINIYIDKKFMIILGIVCGVITCKLCPVLAPTRPVLSKEETKKAKFKESIIIIAFMLVLILSSVSRPINIGFWMLVLHTIQLYIAYSRR